MKYIIVVKNTITSKTFTYERKDIVKARIAVDYLTATTPYLWWLEITAVAN